MNPKKHTLKSGGLMSEEEMNLIVVRAEDQDREALQTILELYQADDTAAFIEKRISGRSCPGFSAFETSFRLEE